MIQKESTLVLVLKSEPFKVYVMSPSEEEVGI